MASLTVGTTPVQLLLPDTTGTSQTNDSTLILQNRGSVEVFFGPTSAVTAAAGADSGIGIAAGQSYDFVRPMYGAGFDLWVVVASGTAELRWVRT
jgi:hypothetical protein